MSEEVLTAEERVRAQQGNNCVFYHDMPCPVQEKLNVFTQAEKLEPVNRSDMERIARDFYKILTSRFTTLAAYCQVCPYLSRRMMEERGNWRNPMIKPIEEEEAKT